MNNTELTARLRSAYQQLFCVGTLPKTILEDLKKAADALEAAQANQVINVDGVFPEWKPGSADFKYWCTQHFGPDADEVYLAEAVLLLPRKTTEPMKAADEFELRRLLAEERFTVSRLSRALQESTEGPTLMGEPVLEAAQPAPQVPMTQPVKQAPPKGWMPDALRRAGFSEDDTKGATE